MRAQSMKSLDTIAVHGTDLEAKDMDGDGNWHTSEDDND